MLNRTVICPSCESRIKLIDKDASGKVAREDVRQAESNIEKHMHKVEHIFK